MRGSPAGDDGDPRPALRRRRRAILRRRAVTHATRRGRRRRRRGGRHPRRTRDAPRVFLRDGRTRVRLPAARGRPRRAHPRARRRRRRGASGRRRRETRRVTRRAARSTRRRRRRDGMRRPRTTIDGVRGELESSWSVESARGEPGAPVLARDAALLRARPTRPFVAGDVYAVRVDETTEAANTTARLRRRHVVPPRSPPPPGSCTRAR